MTERSILTTKDLTLLEVMLDRSAGADDPLLPLLRRKIRHAIVMLRGDVPSDVATLSSRVSFRVDGGEPDQRVLCAAAPGEGAVGLLLPITTRRGLALLGLVEGQAIEIEAEGDRRERLVLERVHYQPEAARNEADARLRLTQPLARRAALRVIDGARAAGPFAAVPRDPDEHGPGAA
jgi:regulator of nucleoside diphosphate kinase